MLIRSDLIDFWIEIRALSCIIGYLRNILNEQKRMDFRPDSDLYITECSPVGIFGVFSIKTI